MNDYEKEHGEKLVFEPKRRKGRPKVDGELRELDIRLTPVDQVEVDFSSVDLSDFKILLICREGEPNGQPRLHYHMYAVTSRSDTYLDKLLNQLGKATDVYKGNAVFSKRKAHDGTKGYVVKNGNVIVRHGLDETYLDELFKKSENYRKEKEKERKTASRSNENFLSNILKDAEVKRLSDPVILTKFILDAYSENGKRFPPKSTVQTAVLSVMYKIDPDTVVHQYVRGLITEPYGNNF